MYWKNAQFRTAQSESSMTRSVRSDKKLRTLIILKLIDRRLKWRISNQINDYWSNPLNWRKTTLASRRTSEVTKKYSIANVCARVCKDKRLFKCTHMRYCPQRRRTTIVFLVVHGPIRPETFNKSTSSEPSALTWAIQLRLHVGMSEIT